VSVDYNKTPWPWFGGKSDAASHVWEALGDVDHYVEPFAGSLAVLLRRPHPANRSYHSETVNDLDGLLVNAWRSIQQSPDAMAEAASWPVSEADLHARHLALLRWKSERNLERLMADPTWHDPVMAGWWAWGQSCWIGSGWCSGQGPWHVGEDGRIAKRSRAESAANAGVSRKLPHLGDNGRGVNHAGTREPGVSRQLPHLTTDGRGVNRPQLREPGVSRKLPHLGNDGKGVNHAGTREPGVSRQIPHLGDNGRGVNHAGTREPGVRIDSEFHAMAMPELLAWFRFLSARLRHVRILNGDWARAVTSGASKTLPVRQAGGIVGIFLDPPYTTAAERASLYTEEDFAVGDACREWALKRGEDSDTRIVLAGYDVEHVELERHGWRVVEWYRGGFLKGGMGNTSRAGTNQQKRERLWLSPHCLLPAELAVEASPQTELWA
jgi:hypothetical protein